MGGIPYSPDEDKIIADAFRKHGGKDGWLKEASDKLPSRQRTSIANRWSCIRGRLEAAGEVLSHAAYANKPLSEKDVVKLWDIDTDIWEAVSLTPRKWDIGAKHPETGEILVKPLYGTMMLFRRKKTATMEQVGKQVVLDILQAAKRKPSPPVTPRILRAGLRRYMAQFNLFDIHLAKYAWAQETGQPYDMPITERIVKSALADLIEQVPRGGEIEQCLLPFGNDYFQVDTLGGTTTAGTQVDHDGRFQKMFRHGHALAMWMIEECAKIAPVHVPVIPGNHDATAAFTMGVVLEAEFRRDKRVTFDNGPAPRKYYRYGKNLLGFTHGDKEPANKLPQIMSVERPREWAESVCREFHIGHFHHGKKAEPISVDDQTGVTVRWIRSLSAADSWHTGKGYVGNQRSAEAFLWRKEGGMRGHFVSLPVEELVA